MNRAIATFVREVRLQVRNGPYAAVAFVVVITVAGLWWLPVDRAGLVWLLPALVFNNLVMMVFFLVAGTVLLERAQGLDSALATTPLRPWESLAARVGALMLLALAQHLALALALFRTVALLPLVIGVALAAALFAVAGLLAVRRATSIAGCLLASLPWTGMLLLPMVTYAAGIDHPLLYLHPLQPAMLLLRGAVGAVELWQIGYGVVGSVAWLMFGAWLCLRGDWQQTAGGEQRATGHLVA